MTLASLASSNSPRVACSAASREQLARGCWQGLTHRNLIYFSASDLTPRSSLTVLPRVERCDQFVFLFEGGI